MPKVTMNLTDRDAQNTEYIRQLTQARSNASAVSIALSLTRFIVGQMREGSELLLRSRTGEMERIVMTELANVPLADLAACST
jgi:hypothetical protein